MIFAFIGYPLSGKTTLAREVCEKFSLPYLSTGDFARSLGMKNEKSIKERDLSIDYDEAIIDEVVRFIKTHENCVVDGFPRSGLQLDISVSFNFEIFFVIADLVNIYSRMSKRERDDSDTHDVVVGRCEAAHRLKNLVLEYWGGCQIVDTSHHLFGERKIMMMDYIKRRMSAGA